MVWHRKSFRRLQDENPRRATSASMILARIRLHMSLDFVTHKQVGTDDTILLIELSPRDAGLPLFLLPHDLAPKKQSSVRQKNWRRLWPILSWSSGFLISVDQGCIFVSSRAAITARTRGPNLTRSCTKHVATHYWSPSYHSVPTIHYSEWLT